MQVTLYTTSTCQYSSAEKQYLDGLGITYSTVVLDQDKSKLPEFIAASGGFSGVPVTVVTDVPPTDVASSPPTNLTPKDMKPKAPGKTIVIKGFDQIKLDEIFKKTPGSESLAKAPSDEKLAYSQGQTMSTPLSAEMTPASIVPSPSPTTTPPIEPTLSAFEIPAVEMPPAVPPVPQDSLGQTAHTSG